MEFIKKICVCDMDIISPEDNITYASPVQEATREYHDIANSKRWEPATNNEKSQDQPLINKAHTAAI